MSFGVMYASKLLNTMGIGVLTPFAASKERSQEVLVDVMQAACLLACFLRQTGKLDSLHVLRCLPLLQKTWKWNAPRL